MTDNLKANPIATLISMGIEHPAENGSRLPVGFRVEQKVSTKGLRVRGSHDSNWNEEGDVEGGAKSGEHPVESEQSEQMIGGVYLPLLAVLIPKWLDQVAERSKEG